MPRRYFKLLPSFPKSGGTIKEFRDWDCEMQTKYPWRWKLNELINDVTMHCIYFPKRRLSELYWKVMHTYHPEYQYHIIRCDSLDPGYHDADTLILHGPFEVFRRFMEHQLSGKGSVQWTFDDSDKTYMSQEEIDRRNRDWADALELYEYWTYERPTREGKYRKDNPPPERPPKEWGVLSMLNTDFDDEPVMLAHRKYFNDWRATEQSWKATDQQMLLRLINLREILWD